MKFQLFLKPSDQLTLAVIAAGSLFFLLTWHGLSTRHQPAPRPKPEYRANLVVDINEAKWTELAMLPGIGEALARAIVEYRSRNGRFESLQGVAAIDGIGQFKLQRMRPYLSPLPSNRQRLVNHRDTADIR